MDSNIDNETILQEEQILYIKKKLIAMPGKLILTEKRLLLAAHKSDVLGLGLIGSIATSLIKKKIHGFNLEFKDIKKIAKGKFGLNKNVLEITDPEGNAYKIVVKDFKEWEILLQARI